MVCVLTAPPKSEKHSLHVHAKDSSHTSILGTFALNVDVLLLTAKHVNATPMLDEPRRFGWGAPVRLSPAINLLARARTPYSHRLRILTHPYIDTYIYVHLNTHTYI